MSFELLTVLCCCGGLMALAAAGSSTSLSRAALAVVVTAAAAARRPLPACSDLPLQSVRRSQRKPFSHALTKSGLPANDWDAALPMPPMRRRRYLTPTPLADTTSHSTTISYHQLQCTACLLPPPPPLTNHQAITIVAQE